MDREDVPLLLSATGLALQILNMWLNRKDRKPKRQSKPDRRHRRE